MAALTTQQISPTGITPTFVACTSGGDTFTPGPKTFLDIKNGAGATVTVTIDTTAIEFGEPIANVVVSIPVSTEMLVGPFQPAEVEQGGTGQAQLTYSAVTSLTIAVLTHQ